MNASKVKNNDEDKDENEVNTMKNYIVKTKIGTEVKVMEDIAARLEGAGSMKDKKEYIGDMISPAHLKGYIFAEATEEHYLEAVLGIITTGNSLRIKNVIAIVGEVLEEEIKEHSKIRKGCEGLEVGMLVSLKDGAWKGEEARIISINEINDTLSLELWGGHVPIPIDNVMANSVRGI